MCRHSAQFCPYPESSYGAGWTNGPMVVPDWALHAIGVFPSPQQGIVGLVLGSTRPARAGAHVVGGHAASSRRRLVGARAVQEEAVVEGAVARLQQDGLFALVVDGPRRALSCLAARRPSTPRCGQLAPRGGCPVRPTSSRFQGLHRLRQPRRWRAPSARCGSTRSLGDRSFLCRLAP